MNGDSTLQAGVRLARRFVIVGVAAALLSGAFLACAVFVPLRPGERTLQAMDAGRLWPLPEQIQSLEALLRKTAGRRLIRAAGVQAAVKDTGAAKRLAERLKLQGIVQIGDGLIAYVQLGNSGSKALRAGEKILDFTVERIEPGKVTLSLEGVEVVLTH